MDVEHLRHQIKERMSAIALKHFRELEPATALLLAANGIDVAERPGDQSELAQSIRVALASPQHPDKVDAGMGPLLVLQDREDATQRWVVSVPELLLQDDQELRSSVIQYIQSLDQHLTLRTRQILSDLSGLIASEVASDWQKAAVTLFDALEDDWALNIAGVKQSLLAGYNAAITRYLERVLRPSAVSVDRLDLPWFEPRRRKDELALRIREIAASSARIDEALSAYWAEFGHLPLGGTCSLGGLVAVWQEEHGRVADAWGSIWTWADQQTSPIARYHVCSYFAANMSSLPIEQVETLGREVRLIVHPSADASDGDLRSPWLLRAELARHYCQHIEALLPNLQGDAVAAAAWWMSDMLASLFGPDTDLITKVRKAAIDPHAELSARIWQLAHSRTKASELRYATLYVDTVWSVSLLCTLEPQGCATLVPTLPQQDQEAIAATVSAYLVGTFPSEKEAHDVVFAFDASLQPLAEAWIAATTSSEARDALSRSIALGHALRANLTDRLQHWAQLDELEQLLLAAILRTDAFTTDSFRDKVEELLWNDSWREAHLQYVIPSALGTLSEALTEYQLQGSEKWARELPHLLAISCELATDDARRNILFTVVMYSAMAGRTLSAIERLVNGANRRRYLDLAQYWRERIDEVRGWAPPLVASRFRATIAKLSIH